MYWIALASLHDQWHAEAIGSANVARDADRHHRGSALGIPRPFLRTRPDNPAGSVRYVEGIQTDPGILVLQQSHQTFLAGLALYKARPDKGYSLTDCISMEAMRQEGIVGSPDARRPFHTIRVYRAALRVWLGGHLTPQSGHVYPRHSAQNTVNLGEFTHLDACHVTQRIRPYPVRYQRPVARTDAQLYRELESRMAAQRTLRPDTPEISTSDVTRQADQSSGITATPEPSSDLTEEELADQEMQRRMVESGLLSEIKPPFRLLPPRERFTPIPILGEPLSETVIRERR